MLFDHLVQLLQRAPRKLRRRALKLQKQLVKRKAPKVRKRRAR